MRQYERHYEESATVAARPDEVFAVVDDPARLASHMTQSSWMLGGGRMSVDIDAGLGQAIGSHIRMGGTVLGIALSLDEVVTRREPPRVKAWETVGTPRLLVIGPYRMTVAVEPERGGARLRVAIDYDLPAQAWLGRIFGGLYARWCVRRMLRDTAAHVGSARASPHPV